MPPPNPNAKRMTAQPLKPARHRAGKKEYEVASDSESEEEEKETQTQIKKPVAKPAATSFRPKAYQIVHIQKSLVAEREEKDRAARLAARAAELEVASEEEDEDEEGSEGEEEESSEAESDSSEDRRQARLKNFRPTFVKKDQRGQGKPEKNADDAWYEQEARRKQMAQEALEEQVERVKEEKRLGKIEWDDDTINEVSIMQSQQRFEEIGSNIS